jgi:hypothetical protein
MSVVNVVYPDGKRVPLFDLCVSSELVGDVNPNVSTRLDEETDPPMDVTVPERKLLSESD